MSDIQNRSLFETIYRFIGAWFGENYPRQWIAFRYWLRFHKCLHLKTPQNLNEKILYLSLTTDTSLWTDLSDKYRVREYVNSCGYGESLSELYGVWEDARFIDFDALPLSFVLKTNHGCGDIQIVNNKKDLDKEKIISYFNNLVKKKYGAIEAGLHYLRIKPCIIAEQLLRNDPVSQKYSQCLIDYKMWCFNGKCHYIMCCCNRDKQGLDMTLYDREWNSHPEQMAYTSHFRKGRPIPKPQNLDLMFEMAETLARPFPCVRVDLYNVGGKIYFGEMTYTSLGGLMNYYTPEFLDKAGKLIDLNYKG